MKKSIVITALILTVACKKNESNNANVILIKGEFVSYNDASLLLTQNEIFGVLASDKTNELKQQAKPYKKDSTDVVLVEIKGTINQKEDPKILWKNKIEVVEIVSVKPMDNTKKVSSPIN